MFKRLFIILFATIAILTDLAAVEAFGDGFALVGSISDITGGNGQNYGCNIVIDAVEG